MMRLLLVAMLVSASISVACRCAAADANPGRAAYLKYCSACHGSDGHGDGIVSTVLRPKPTDLTQLAKTHGGTFPYMQVNDVIDGRQHIAAHGSSEMPVWGMIFSERKAAAQPEAQVRGEVQLITDYLSTIQQ